MVGVRYQIEVLADRTGAERLEVSLAERWAEGELESSTAGGNGHGNGTTGSPVRPPTRVGQ
jgi:hypothetical protein